MGVVNDIHKWKKSVIHLEGLERGISAQERGNLIKEYRIKLENGEIDSNEFYEIISKGNKDSRYQGTAIFFEKDNNRYLLTARHVVYNDEKDYIFNPIFRVPSLDELFSDNVHNFTNLMNLSAGSTQQAAYSISESELDLAIISLRGIYSKFGDELIESGYIPLTINDISSEVPNEGSDIFSIGFPINMSTVEKQNLPQALKNWESEHCSLPVSSFGKVSMIHEKLDYFLCDISIYPGNSGGPIVENNKLVGIVTAQSFINEEISANEQLLSVIGKQKMPFIKIVRAKHIFELLNIQIKKDKAYESI